MKYLFYLITIISILSSCDRTKDKAKDIIKGSGEIVGKTISEFGKGVTEGVEETFEVKITETEELKNKGIELGKINFENDSVGTDNVLNVYMIFNKNFNDTIRIKVYDNNNLEMGRSRQSINAKAGDASFYNFHFDKRTNIDSDSKITME